jgi:hypothetical protein
MRLLAFILLFLPFPALAAQCPRPDPPEVEVILAQDDVEQDSDLSIAQLKEMMSEDDGSTKAMHGGREHFPLGVTATRAGYTYGVEVLVQTHPDGTHCASLSKLTLEFRFADVHIHLARELPSRSCIQREVLAHENRHVAVDRNLVQSWKNRISDAAKQAARSVGTITVRNVNTAPATLAEQLKPELDTAINRLLEDRARLQALVDSPAEYSRISRVCNGAAQGIVRKALR